MIKNIAGLLLVIVAMAFSSCELVEGIFKAGFWTAIILVVVIAGLILWLIGRSRK